MASCPRWRQQSPDRRCACIVCGAISGGATCDASASVHYAPLSHLLASPSKAQLSGDHVLTLRWASSVAAGGAGAEQPSPSIWPVRNTPDPTANTQPRAGTQNARSGASCLEESVPFRVLLAVLARAISPVGIVQVATGALDLYESSAAVLRAHRPHRAGSVQDTHRGFVRLADDGSTQGDRHVRSLAALVESATLCGLTADVLQQTLLRAAAVRRD